MATIYLKHPLNEIKKFDKKLRNEPLKIHKTLKDDLFLRQKISPIIAKPTNDLNFPEVIRTTPQKNYNDDFLKLDSKINSNISKELGTFAHRRPTSNSNNSFYESHEKRNSVFLL